MTPKEPPGSGPGPTDGFRWAWGRYRDGSFRLRPHLTRDDVHILCDRAIASDMLTLPVVGGFVGDECEACVHALETGP